MYKITSNSEEETIELAENIESERFPNMVICLEGDLGSGKTLFTKGFASSMGIKENVTSPTFNIIKEYTGEDNSRLYHIDVYRINDVKEDLGLPDYFKKRGVTIIEWSDMIPDQLPKNRLEIRIKMIDENTRVFLITPYGEKYIDLCERVL